MMSLPTSGPSRISEHIYHLLTTQLYRIIFTKEDREYQLNR